MYDKINDGDMIAGRVIRPQRTLPNVSYTGINDGKDNLFYVFRFDICRKTIKMDLYWIVLLQAYIQDQ
jgi:hypothetical protein